MGRVECSTTQCSSAFRPTYAPKSACCLNSIPQHRPLLLVVGGSSVGCIAAADSDSWSEHRSQTKSGFWAGLNLCLRDIGERARGSDMVWEGVEPPMTRKTAFYYIMV